MKRGVNRRSEGADRHRLCQSRDAFEKDMTIGEQPDQQSIHELLLADDDLRNLFPQLLYPPRSRLHLFIQTVSHVSGDCRRAATLTQVIWRSRFISGTKCPQTLPLSVNQSPTIVST